MSSDFLVAGYTAEPSVASVGDSSREAVHTPPDLMVRLELPGRKVTAGALLNGTLVLTNRTGTVMTVSGCGTAFDVYLSNAAVHPDRSQRTLCLQTFRFRAGVSRLPFQVPTTYPGCSPVPDGVHPTCVASGPPPLPPGTYQARLQWYGPDGVVGPRTISLPLPKPLDVRVL
jgi:hypothetical protein